MSSRFRYTIICASVFLLHGFGGGISERTFMYDAPIDAVSIGVAADEINLEVSALQNNGWTKWYVLEIEKEFDPMLRESNLILFPEETTAIRVRGKQQEYAVHPIRVSKDPVRFSIAARIFSRPTILSRRQWGADESLLVDGSGTARSDISYAENSSSTPSERVQECQRLQEEHPSEFRTTKTLTRNVRGQNYRWPQRYSPKVQVLTVHHTAQKVTGDNRSGVERMRALYEYHANSRGWGDIGYNFVIDEEGQIYEGRAGGKSVVGGHAYCANVGTIGIALMGNFEVERPTQTQVKSLQWLLADLADEYRITLSRKIRFHGSNMEPIVGHKTFVSTMCPGYYIWETLSQIRRNTSSGNTNNPVRFPRPPGITKTKRTIRSALDPTLTAVGSTELTGPPGGQTRLSLLFRAGSSTAQRRSRIADVIRSDSRIGIWQELNGREMRVRRELILAEAVRKGKTLILSLRIQFPRDSGTYTLRIGNVSYMLRVTGKRIDTERFTSRVSTMPPPTRVQQSISRPRPVRTSRTPTVTPSQSTTSDSIRIRLGYENDTATIYSNRGLLIEGKTDSHARINLSKNGSRCVAMEGSRQLAQGRVRLISRDGITTIESWEKNANRFRGIIECRIVDGELTLINELPLESYLSGLAEEPDTEPYEKQRAFAIAARSYAAHYMESANRKFPGKPYDGDDSPARFQKYGGVAFEQANAKWTQAVRSTDGIVVMKNGQVVKTPYFSSDDGRTRSPEENGWSNFPFAEVFSSKPDPWCAGLELRGHGVGMSGCGSEAQAEEGKSAEEILEYYYPGTGLRARP